MAESAVCYLERAERGALLTRLRLLVGGRERTWTPPANAEAPDRPGDAAAWLAGVLKEESASLDALVLDADGAVCSWASGGSSDPDVIRAAIEQQEAEHAGDDAGGDNASGIGGRFPDLPGEVRFEPLAPPEAARRGREEADTAVASRLPVLAIPDAPVRLLLDELDGLGVRPDRVLTIWHTAAAAWAPHVRPASDGRVVGESAGTLGTVLLDVAGRLLWCWHERGALVAAGSQRLSAVPAPAAGPGEEPRRLIAVEPADASRLVAEWVSWSAQIGAGPERVVLVAPEELGEGLGARHLADVLERAWPDASVDLQTEPDPVLTTLARLQDRRPDGKGAPPDPRRAVLGLTRRPGRVHRAMYRWAGLALAIGGVALGLVGWRLYGAAAAHREAAADLRANQARIIAEAAPDLVNEFGRVTDPLAPRTLADRAAAVSRPPPALPRPYPVLEEFEAITLVAGAGNVELRKVSVGGWGGLAEITAVVESTEQATTLFESLRSISGSAITWERGSNWLQRQSDGRVEVRLTGSLNLPASPAAGVAGTAAMAHGGGR